MQYEEICVGRSIWRAHLHLKSEYLAKFQSFGLFSFAVQNKCPVEPLSCLCVPTAATVGEAILKEISSFTADWVSVTFLSGCSAFLRWVLG